MMKKDEKNMKTMFKPRITNKLIDIDYEDKNIKIAKYYNKRDKYGYHMHNGLSYIYVFDEYENREVVHAILDFDSMSNGWWYGSNFFNSHEEIAKFWAEKMIIPPAEFVSKKDKERMEMESLINAHICEVSEGMMSLSHVG